MSDTTNTTNARRFVLRAAGSLWFAAVLLILVLVTMAYATVFESIRGTEQALAFFYKSWWFKLLLALLGLNILAALLSRYPFSRRQIGFVLAHVSILLILSGALVTQYWGIDGQVGILVGKTASQFGVRQGVLSLTKVSDASQSSVDLDPSVFGGFHTVDDPGVPPVSLDDVRIEVERYVPDSSETRRVVNDSPNQHLAVEVSLSTSGQTEPTWVFAGQSVGLGPVAVMFRHVGDREELSRLLAEAQTTQPASKGMVKIEYKDSTFEFPIEDCMEQEVPLGTTGRTIRVLRYLPHAVVGADNVLYSASDKPVNPAIEVEVDGPAGKTKRPAFARFPDFRSMHGGRKAEAVKVTFVAPTRDLPTVPIEVLGGPEGDLYVRFSPAGGDVVTQELAIGVPVESPWPGHRFTVLRQFENARVERLIQPAESIRKDHVSAILLKVSLGQQTTAMWLQRYVPHLLEADGETYEVSYADKQIPLGFELTLDRFQIGHYPGTSRPRSFESHVTVLNPVTGRKQSRVVSMNHPATFGGYTLYQSSYRQEEGHTASFLSVSWDPGQPIVFAGYIGTMVGMLWVLAMRMFDRRRNPKSSTSNCRPERTCRT